ncbi:MAG TPA: ABC transporter ATP-binding protein [Candidatus Scatomorpha intestinavium]|uniref:ABC transporter ATP-binding protein n=1 Tax=Candidatus Scatomorpha intestinavium TaxID=2840922 RepID=A0A9D1CS55_9FIRM|nr:ABC transporter ATP-binding protein [Candidatus Scatomorpha intestinavium]
MSKNTDRKHSIADVLRRLFSYNGKLKLPMAVALLFAAAGAVLTIVGPSLLSDITDIISNSLFAEIDLAAIGDIGMKLLALYLVSAVLTYVEHYIMSTVTLELSRDLRRDLSRKINVVPMSYFNTVSHGDILSRVTNDVSTLQQALANSLPSMISAAAQFVGCLIMMFATEWRMASAAVAVTLVGFIIMGIAMLRSQKYFTARQDNLSTLNGYVEEMYSGHDVVRISRANDQIKETFSGMNDDLYDADWHSQFLSGIMQPLMTVIGNLGYVAVCVIGAALVMDGEIGFGVIVAFIMYVRLFTSPLSTLAQGMTQMQTAAAAGGHIFDFLGAEELPEETGKRSAPQEVRGEVDFEHVRFSYPNNPGKTIIKDFSAHVEPGQKVAIVGPTGAGKTTLVNLLMRFYEINSGTIKIDGIPTNEMTRESVHNLFGMVLQDTWLFDGTVRENLVYNKTGVTDGQLEKACRACGIYHFIETLPKGFDTVLDDSIAISAGQKQLLTIARAMIQDNPMLILDEATSSVDTRTELITQRAMDSLTANRTSFVIAHRLSTIKNADLILVLKDGDIIEQGTHEELLAKGGFYAGLYMSQFEKTA